MTPTSGKRVLVPIMVANAIFVTLALLSGFLFNHVPSLIVFGLFSVVIPCVNWKSTNTFRIPRVIVLFLASMVLFYAGMLIAFSAYEWVIIALGGITSVLVYVSTSSIVKDLNRGILQYAVVFVAGVIPFLLTYLISQNSNTSGDLFFKIWIVAVGLSMTLGQLPRSIKSAS
jgi:hypothetical protein